MPKLILLLALAGFVATALSEQALGQTPFLPQTGFQYESYNTLEDSGGFSVCVVVFAPLSTQFLNGTHTLRVSTSHGSATSGDYTSLNNQEVGPFTNTTRRQCFAIEINDDDLIEPLESFSLVLTPYPSNASVNVSPNMSTVNINDTDKALLDVNLSPVNFSESDGEVTVNISATIRNSLFFADDRNLTVSLSGGSGVSKPPPFNVTIPARNSSVLGSFSLNISDDALAELNETVTVRVHSPEVTSFYTSGNAITVLDDDTSLSLAVDPVWVGEGDGAVMVAVNASFDLGKFLQNDANVTIKVENGTAEAGADFGAVDSFNVTIPAMSSNGSAVFSLRIIDDDTFEGDETFSVNGTIAAGFHVSPATIDILDDDMPPRDAPAENERRSSQSGSRRQTYVDIPAATFPWLFVERSAVYSPLRISKDAPFVLNLSERGVTIASVKVAVNSDVPGPVLVAARFRSKPSAANGTPPGTLYEYVGVAADGLNPAFVDSIAVTFAVSREWMSGNGFGNENVGLFAYDKASSSWVDANAALAEETSTGALFSAEIKGAEIFAIVGRSRPQAPEPEAPEIPPPDGPEEVREQKPPPVPPPNPRLPQSLKQRAADNPR